ncbi:methylated-DNA--[protein]-cysteine S-methyltransferase [Ensifer sp. Root278]|jgi:O-6-methylguanine DNA methyltransferase|uniref:methylated-DNA--[protein]-cysteine S-methyltransferase n=1 Tax=unclassified Ensifer TaxID=2633371 RepID=UPI00070A4B16|nr:methylated-DNA--[protein]-cysteine S-methyltransferase [Ensifer sp. Root278]KRD68192.1 cysteine methyltransferase [Ensifer sp. Root278]
MNLMIKTDALRPQSLQHSPSTTAGVLSYAVADCELSKVLVARSAKGVCSILLGDSAEELTADLANRFPKSTLVASEAVVKNDVAKVLRYIAKPSGGLQLTLDMRGTPFQRRVWEKLKAIAVGRTVSYMELARWIGPFANPRAVAGACAANPIALAIPCHRVVRTDGDLAGYRWGLERKRTLIEKEATL